MIEKYYSNRLGTIYICVEPGGRRSSYIEMIEEDWQKASSVDRKVTNLVKVRWESLRSTNSYGTVSGQSNNQQHLFYVKDTGITNIRVPFYFYSNESLIILFSFKKKDKKQENKLFGQAEKLQLKINKWVEDHDFPST